MTQPHGPGKPSLMAEDKLAAFVSQFFDGKKKYLDAVKKHGSPLYFLETRVLQRRADRFRAAFEALLPETSFFYAVKSNCMPAVCSTLLENGFGLDVSSALELELALALNARQIIFSGPGKTVPELEMALDNADRVTLLMDSAGEFEKLSSLALKKKKKIKVGIRLNNTPEGLWRKFGIVKEALLPFYQKIKAHPFIEFTGLQFHSSWNLTPERQAAFITDLGNFMETLPKEFHKDCRFVDIGGGFWPGQGEWEVSDNPLKHYCTPADSIELFAARISAALHEKILPLTGCRICFEPGRWLCNDAMHILLQVVDVKDKDLVITDGGTNAVGWERFESDYFPVLNLSRPAMTETPCHILGALCTPHDVWGYACFGNGLHEGDILMIPTQGAYTYSLRQHFIKPLPKVVIHT